jgi:hypothetical protein
MMGYTKLNLNPLGILPFVLYGEQNLPQTLTSDAHIFLKSWTIAQNLLDVTGPHMGGFHGYLENRLGALQADRV